MRSDAVPTTKIQRSGKPNKPQTLPPISEREFLQQVVELAALRGWLHLHLRPAMTRDSWRTPISGPLGKGFPDLMLVRGERILFIELKRDGAKPTPEQVEVLGILGGAAETMLVWPNDWDLIEQVLR
jgi:hypothetical protein